VVCAALLLYGLAYVLFLHALNFFDAFHHTFEQYFVEPDEAAPPSDRNAHTNNAIPIQSDFATMAVAQSAV